MNLYDDLLSALQLEKIGDYLFLGKNVNIGSANIYGGHVLSQAIHAASRCASEDKTIHSIHGYFLHPGNNFLDIQYEVEPIKMGKSFDVLKVMVSQQDKVIFILNASFHLKEEGIEHQVAMPNVVEPSRLQPFSEIFENFAKKFNIEASGIISDEGPFIFHPLEYYDPFNPGIRSPKQHLWFKPNGNIPQDRITQNALLGYVSDFNLLITALLPHNISFFTTPMKIASLDHAMWFHTDHGINGWMLYEVESIKAANGRAYCTGKIFSKEGNLVASVCQEGLIRMLK
jgi:acyl-CoA thioesterase II